MAERSEAAERKSCLGCGAPFNCDVKGDCWCFHLPALTTKLAGDNCYCPTCLEKVLNSR